MLLWICFIQMLTILFADQNWPVNDFIILMYAYAEMGYGVLKKPIVIIKV